MVLGFINDAKGQKMSKSRGNTIDPWAVLESVGADPLRWYLYTCAAPDMNKNFDLEQLNQVVRGFFLTLWNSYSFFVMYANLDQPRLMAAPDASQRPPRGPLDSRRRRPVGGQVLLPAGRVRYPCRGPRDLGFVVNELSNWYIRLNRRRYWKSDDDGDKQSAYATLYEVLVTVAKLCAPSRRSCPRIRIMQPGAETQPDAALSVIWPNGRKRGRSGVIRRSLRTWRSSLR